MLQRLIRSTTLLSLAALLAGCLTGPPPFPAHATMADALGQVLDQRVTIAYQEPFDKNRALILFRTDKHPGLSPTLLERTPLGKWRMTDSVGLGFALPSLGPLTYDRGNVGRVEEKVGTVTHSRAEANVVFGEVLDPAITWVELTLYDKGAQPIRATVHDRTWLVKLPPEKQNTWFALRAGDANGQRFAANVGSVRSRDLDPATAPLVAYQDELHGIRLEHPNIADTDIDEEGRLIVAFDAWRISVAGKRHPGDADLDQLLRAAVAAGGDQVLEHGIRPLGPHRAAYLLESRPGPDGNGATYHERYLVLAGGSEYELTCAVPHVFSQQFWTTNLKPVCDRVLMTARLGNSQQ